MFKRSSIGPTFIVLFLASFVLAQDKPPVAPVREVTDEYFGQKVVDPYRWMEDLKSEEMTEWMKAQADYTVSISDLACIFIEKVTVRSTIDLDQNDNTCSKSHFDIILRGKS